MIRCSHALLLAFAVSLGARAAGAAVNQWTPVGPFRHGGMVTAIAVAPSDPFTVIAGTFSGPFRSADAGQSWASISDGLTSQYVTGVAIDPGTPTTVYVVMGNPAAGLYKSTDSGASWTLLLSLPEDFPYGTITIDPTDPRILYFGSQAAIRKSTDGGASWTASDEGFNGFPVASIAVDPTSHSTLYAAAGPVYKSTDGGAHWVATGLADAHAVRIAPSDPSTLYAVTLAGVFVSHDGAQTWTAGGAITGVPADLAVDPGSAGTAYITGVDGVLKSTDGGASWQLASSGLPGGPMRCVFAITIASDGTLYVANICEPEGLFRSSDAAVSWTDVSGGFGPIETRGVAASTVSPAVYAATDAGIFRTLDGGGSWTPLNGGLSDLNAQQVVPDPADPAILYARTATAVFKTIDGGLTWTNLRAAPFRALAIAPSAPSTLYAAGDGSFWKTTNGGASWQSSQPFDAVIQSLVVDGRSAAVVLAGTENGVIFRSSDGGTTWGPVLTVLPYVSFPAIVAAPGSPETVYAGWVGMTACPMSCVPAGGVYKSTDDGATWTSVSVGDGTTAIAVDPNDSSTVYVATTRSQIARSTDGGTTFASVNAGLPATGVAELAISSSASSTVYAAAWIAGVYRASFVSCSNDGAALCLGDGRFRVEVDWRRTPGDPAQKAHAAGVSAESGYFWFVDPDSVELVVKVLDGRSINGFFWVFYGALTDRGYTVTVTDRETGAVRTYTNDPGHVGSRADTSAFAGTGPGAEEGPDLAMVLATDRTSAAPEEPCVADAISLCLNGGRFRVQVGVTTSPTGPTVAAPAVGLTPDSGAFVFRDLGNLELAVKVLDGTFVNGHFWVFVGGLTNRAFEVVISDTVTGQAWTYDNPAGEVQSVADTAAF